MSKRSDAIKAIDYLWSRKPRSKHNLSRELKFKAKHKKLKAKVLDNV